MKNNKLILRAMQSEQRADFFCAGCFFSLAGYSAQKNENYYEAAWIFELCADAFKKHGDKNEGNFGSYITAAEYYVKVGDNYHSLYADNQKTIWFEKTCEFYINAINVLKKYKGYNAKTNHYNISEKYKKKLSTIKSNAGFGYAKNTNPCNIRVNTERGFFIQPSMEIKNKDEEAVEISRYTK